MDSWTNIVGILVALLVGVALPLLLRRRKKEEGPKTGQFLPHLRSLGVKASFAERGDARERIGLGYASGQKSEGIIELEDRNIDSVNIVSVSSQYGTSYHVDYLVRSPNVAGTRVLKKTRLVRRRSQPIWGKVVGIEWKGDSSLAQTLNLDYSLEDRLLTTEGKVVTGSIGIFPEPGHGYVRIRTGYSPPSAQVFEALCSIARRIRAW